MTEIAIVLGNGRSRLGLDLAALKSFGRVYGCNALYREFAPDVLVSTDAGISEEIQQSGYSKDNLHYTRKPIDGLGSQTIDRLLYGYSSGPVAMGLAAREHSYVYFAGFDLKGDDGKINNIYAGTAHYKPADAAATYYGNWVRQVAEVMRQHPNKKFIRIVDHGHLTPDDWHNHACYSEMRITEFVDMLNNKRTLNHEHNEKNHR